MFICIQHPQPVQLPTLSKLWPLFIPGLDSNGLFGGPIGERVEGELVSEARN